MYVFIFFQIWFSYHIDLPIIDTTATVRAVHQSRPGVSYMKNTYQLRRVNESMHYNERIGAQLA